MDASHYGRGTVLRCPVKVNKYDSKEYCDIPYLDAVGVHAAERNEINIFAVNRNLNEAINLEAEIAGFEEMALAEHRVLCKSDLNAVNSAAGEKVKPVVRQSGRIEGKAGSQRLDASLPPASWNLIKLITSNKG
jgi:alpha-N-arabinofuranosidase